MATQISSTNQLSQRSWSDLPYDALRGIYSYLGKSEAALLPRLSHAFKDTNDRVQNETLECLKTSTPPSSALSSYLNIIRLPVSRFYHEMVQAIGLQGSTFDRRSNFLEIAPYQGMSAQLQVAANTNLLAIWPKLYDALDQAVSSTNGISHSFPSKQNSYPSEIQEFLNQLQKTHPQILSWVTTLDLSNIQCSLLPPEIALFPNLQSLNLRNTNFQANLLNAATLENLNNLRELNLSDNGIRGKQIPNLQNILPKLESLSLNNNPLTNLPRDFFTQATRIKTLSLVNCGINLLPDGFLQNAPDLYLIDLSNNQLTNLPNRFLANSQNANLNIIRNQFGAPIQFSALQNIAIHGNPIPAPMVAPAALPPGPGMTFRDAIRHEVRQCREFCEFFGKAMLIYVPILMVIVPFIYFISPEDRRGF